MSWLIFFVCLLITVMAHEAGHLFASLICKVKVEAYSIGFFKPYLHFKWKGIDWRLTPWLIGGYCKLLGEDNKDPNGLMAQPYRNKFFIITAGVFVNILIAIVCYLINYGSITTGVMVDWLAVTSFFTKDYAPLIDIYYLYEPNMFLWQLSMMNLFCFVSNLLPIPALDGGFLWLPWMEYVWKENYERNLQRVLKMGFVFLMVLQFIIVGWMFI